MGNDIRKSIGLLTRATNEKWFRNMKDHLMAEDLWRVVETPRSIPYPAIKTPTNSEASTPGVALDPNDVKNNAKARLHIRQCLEDDDEEDVAGMNTANEMYQYLYLKYAEKLETTRQDYLREYTTYLKPADKSIQEAHTHLKKLGRKIVATSPTLSQLCSASQIF
ncbi:MAG: hypothetical protein Q9191_008526 [Dirinaria sp. TL-2023a]